MCKYFDYCFLDEKAVFDNVNKMCLQKITLKVLTSCNSIQHKRFRNQKLPSYVAYLHTNYMGLVGATKVFWMFLFYVGENEVMENLLGALH